MTAPTPRNQTSAKTSFLRTLHRPPSTLGFPNRDAAIRLVGAVLAWGFLTLAGAPHDEWAEQRRYLGLDVLARSRAALITTDAEETNHLAIASALSA